MLQSPVLFPNFGKLVLNYLNHKPVISKRPLYYLPIYGNIFLSVGRLIPNASSFNSCKKMFPKFGNYIQGITNFKKIGKKSPTVKFDSHHLAFSYYFMTIFEPKVR